MCKGNVKDLWSDSYLKYSNFISIKLFFNRKLNQNCVFVFL